LEEKLALAAQEIQRLKMMREPVKPSISQSSALTSTTSLDRYALPEQITRLNQATLAKEADPLVKKNDMVLEEKEDLIPVHSFRKSETKRDGWKAYAAELKTHSRKLT
jgi:hypothetical protein